MRITESAGGVVLNPLGEVVVVNQHGNSWSLPKGHIDPGEDPRATALREIREESGIAELAYVRDFSMYERYRIADDGVSEDQSELKRMHMFLFTCEKVSLVPEDPENPEARWVPVDDVAGLLSHPKDKEFFLSIKESLK